MAYFKNEFRSVLYVDDFEASTKFYGEGLELRSNYSWDDGPDDRGVKYLAAGGVIEVIRRDPPIAQGSTVTSYFMRCHLKMTVSSHGNW